MSKFVYIKTFGCQMNERDSEIIEQLLAQDGYLAIDSPDNADLIILNTCSIRAKAEQKVYSMLGQLRDNKAANPNLKIGVAGCVAQQEGQQIFKRMPHVDFVVGTQQIYQLPQMLEQGESVGTKHKIATNLSQSFAIPPFHKLLEDAPPSPSSSGFKRFVTIMQGCNNYCSYCVVPETRGREISRPMNDILDEVRLLVDQGILEITLLGQNVNSYGQTNDVGKPGLTFSDLLQEVAAIEGVQRLRFTTSHPKDLSEKLMRCFAEIKQLCPQFHLPVQSGSNAVLKQMNRKYTVESYLEKVATLRKYRPDIALATDIIVGFPGETDEDFSKTMDLLQEVRYHGSFSFKYSDRPGTRSTDFDNKVPEDVKSKRLKAFQDLQDQISLERNREYLGQKVEVLIESSTATEAKGRTVTNHIVHLPNPVQQPTPGSILQAKINHAGKHSLKGEVTS